MVQVKLLVSRTDGARGDVVTVSADEAQRMVEAGQGELMRKAEPEKAVKRAQSEKASK